MISATNILNHATDLDQYRDRLRAQQSPKARRVRICLGTGCSARGAYKVLEAFRRLAAATDAGAPRVEIETKCTGCHGFCDRGPIVVIDPDDVFYQRVQEEDVEEIWSETVLGGRVVDWLLYENERTEAVSTAPGEIPFFRGQQRVVLAHNGHIDPKSIEDYVAAGGYAALAKALTSMKPDDVIEEIHRAGLRGRGGGGFPTARKWRTARDAEGEPKYVIANGDEGDPVAFLDRSLMEGAPHAVLEGLIIGGYAIGASRGYLYTRNDYAQAIEHLTLAIEQARQLHLLGENILGSGFDFDLQISRGGGAFVCGEATALIATLEGRPGEPRPTYVPMAEAGLHGRPTVMNNVETWATVPPIILNGADWFAGFGTETAKGTKVFSLMGKVTNKGLVEVPLGTTLRELVFEIGGGMAEGNTFKAAQTGGPTGGCIPAEFLDEPVDFDMLTKLGSIMGSGGVMVMDENTCMVAVAKYFVEFLKAESCGKCTPCREGLAQMHEVLTRITKGNGREGDIETLEQLAELMADTSLCGLGQTAAHPVLTSIRRFRDEYEEHIRDRHCPGKVCQGLFRYEIDAEHCKGCGLCARKCPIEGISGGKKQPHTIDEVRCIQCGTCFEVCPFTTVMRI